MLNFLQPMHHFPLQISGSCPCSYSAISITMARYSPTEEVIYYLDNVLLSASATSTRSLPLLFPVRLCFPFVSMSETWNLDSILYSQKQDPGGRFSIAEIVLFSQPGQRRLSAHRHTLQHADSRRPFCEKERESERYQGGHEWM